MYAIFNYRTVMCFVFGAKLISTVRVVNVFKYKSNIITKQRLPLIRFKSIE